MAEDYRACQECRFVDGSCRRFVIGHPDPVCLGGYRHPVARSGMEDDMEDDMDGLDLLIPAPRRSQENVGVR